MCVRPSGSKFRYYLFVGSFFLLLLSFYDEWPMKWTGLAFGKYAFKFKKKKSKKIKSVGIATLSEGI